MNDINSKNYWDGRFETGDWKKNGGSEQAEYFANLFQKNVPDWMVNYIRDRRLSVLDLGCAQGEGTKVLSEIWNGQVSGADFSEDAVKIAREQDSNIHFEVQDALNLNGTWDVIFMSNILEHFEKPYDVLAKVQEHARHMVIVMVPFEETMDISEHFARFTFGVIPLVQNDFMLIYSNNILEYDDAYPGQQMILAYSRDEELNRRVMLRESSNIIKKWTESQDYIRFKERLFSLTNEYAYANKQLGLLEYQLNEEHSHSAGLEQSLRESQTRAADLEQSLRESQTRAADLEQNLRESQTRAADLEQSLRESQTRAADLEQSLRESNDNTVALEQELDESKNQVAALTKSALEADAETQKLKKELKERNFVYDDLYAYSARRDAELERIAQSKSYRFFMRYFKAPLHIGYVVYLKLCRILRYLFTLHFSLFAKEFSEPVKRYVRKKKGKKQLQQLYKSLKADVKDRTVIVMPPTLDWNMQLFQRPQQLAMAYARKKDTVVIYMTANLKHDNVAVADQIMDSLWLFNSGYTKELPEILKQAKTVIMSLSWTINKGYIDQIKPDKLIYEYIDELEIFDKYDEQMITDHQRLMSMANVTVCTATKLYNKAKGKATNPILSPNAGDFDFFVKTPKSEINPLIRERASQYQCVLGYYGALASWFDYELVKMVAKKHPDWLFVLVGINYDGTLDKSEIDQFENIVYVPPQPYKELPSFLTAFDVATIPFVINEITLSTSPVKLFEYMAGGKPILTSKMPECLKYESVRTYADADEFCRIVEEYLAMKPDDPYWDVLKREALENTWDARTDQILQTLEAD